MIRTLKFEAHKLGQSYLTICWSAYWPSYLYPPGIFQRNPFTRVRLTYFCVSYLYGCFLSRIPSDYRVYAFKCSYQYWVLCTFFAFIFQLAPHNMSSSHIYMFTSQGMRFPLLAAFREAMNSCQANQEYLVSAGSLYPSPVMRHVHCPHFLLSYILYNIFLSLVHASRNTEQPSLCIIPYAFNHVNLPATATNMTVIKNNYLLGFLAVNRIVSQRT